MQALFKRIQIILLLVLSIPFTLWRRAPARKRSHFLLFQGSSLGDMVCTTPLFRAIKQRYPHSKLTLVGNALNKELLSGNPRIDEYKMMPQGFFALARLFRETQADYALMTSPSAEVLSAFLLAGIPEIVVPEIKNGWSPYQTKSYSLLSRFVTRAPHHMGSYAPREYLRLLAPAGIFSEDTRKELYVSAEALAQAERIFSRAPKGKTFFLGMAPSAGSKVKAWPEKNFAEVAKYLLKKYDNLALVLIGGKGDKNESEQVLSLLPETSRERVLDTVGRLSTEELKAVVSQLNLFVSADTGPIYVAEAFGVATVDIVGPMDENEQPPRGERHRVVVPARSAPAIHIMNAAVYDEREVRRQAEAITPEMVLKEIESLMENMRG